MQKPPTCLNMGCWGFVLWVDAYSHLEVISINHMWGCYSLVCGWPRGLVVDQSSHMLLRPLNAKVRGSSFFSWLFSWADDLVYCFIFSEFTCLSLNKWDTPSLRFPLGPDGFWLCLQRLPNPCSNFALRALCGGAGWAGASIPNPHIRADSSLSWALSLAALEGGRENIAIFQKNKYGLFVFVFASMLNSDCTLRLDTTIIINFPVCSSILVACHKDEMMDNVRCGNWMSWGKGKEGKDRCFIMRFRISVWASRAEA